MEAVQGGLDPRDGVACFNRMYLSVTRLLGGSLAEGFFADDAFTERLAVVFAGLYFDAVDADLAGIRPHPVWTPVFGGRGDRRVWPAQFALAGMNAHIAHDLALAVVATCEERKRSPYVRSVHADYLKVNELLERVEAEIREAYEPPLLRLATKDAEALEHILSTFSVARARDAAWATALTLWAQRDDPILRRATLSMVSAAVVMIGRLLVTPIVPPPG